MKKILYILSILIFSVGCSNFLDEKVFTSATYEEFYKTESDLEAALTGAYSKFQVANYYDQSILEIGDISTDLVDCRWSNNVYNEHTLQKDKTNYTNIWDAMWAANNSLNCLIVFGADAEVTDETFARIMGEARFLRALNYFNLVRIYGAVPLILTPTISMTDDLYPATSTVDEIYALIIEDLEYAIESLKTNTQQGSNVRATKGSAVALLAKVYLTMAGYRKADDFSTYQIVRPDEELRGEYYQAAHDLLEQVINQEVGAYALNADFGEIFTTQGENGAENVFSIQFAQGYIGGTDTSEGSNKQTRWAPQNYGVTIASYELYRMAPAFYNSYNVNDKRKAVTFLDAFVDADGVSQSYPTTLSHVWCKKYLRDLKENGDGFVNTAAKDGEENTIVMRYSDILLMHSEAEYFLGNTTEALWGINQVRLRAGLNELGDWFVSSEENFINALLDEREFELIAEGHLWFDYTRLGVHDDRVTTYSYSYTVNKFYTWPIPAAEILKNPNLIQSIGW